MAKRKLTPTEKRLLKSKGIGLRNIIAEDYVDAAGREMTAFEHQTIRHIGQFRFSECRYVYHSAK